MDVIFALLTLGNVKDNRTGKLTLILRVDDWINTDQPLAVDAGFNQRSRRKAQHR